MRLSLKIVLTGLAVTLFMSGCAKNIRVKAVNVTGIGAMSGKSRVAVVEFKNDKYDLTSKIESKIAKHNLNEEKYYTVTGNKNIQRIITDNDIRFTDITDTNTSAKVGKLAEAQVVLGGEIIYADSTRDSYESPEKECISETEDKVCVKYRYFGILCKTVKADISVNFKIVDTKTASIIHDDIINKEYFEDSCEVPSDSKLVKNNNYVPPSSLIFQKLTSEIADEFASRLAPEYIYFDATLLSSIELEDVTSEQNADFEKALLHGKNDEMQKAEDILTRLHDELGKKSYVVAYTLGLIKEAQGEYAQAKMMYDTANTLSGEDVDEVKSALERISISIEKRDE